MAPQAPMNNSTRARHSLRSDTITEPIIHEGDQIVVGDTYDETDGFVVNDDQPLEYVDDVEDEPLSQIALTPPPLSQIRRRALVLDSDDEPMTVPNSLWAGEPGPAHKTSTVKAVAARSGRIHNEQKAIEPADDDDDDDEIVNTPIPNLKFGTGLSKTVDRSNHTSVAMKRAITKPVPRARQALPNNASLSTRKRKIDGQGVLSLSDPDTEDLNTRLVGDDSMYPENTSKRVIAANLKQPMVKTPPLKTRAAGAYMTSSKANPVKKAKLDGNLSDRWDIEDDEGPSIASKLQNEVYPHDIKPRVALATSIKRETVTRREPVGIVEKSIEPRNAASEVPSVGNIIQSQIEDTNRALKVPGSTGAQSFGREGVFLPRLPPPVAKQTLKSQIWRALPFTKLGCEVEDPVLFDDSLDEVGGYDNLPLLRECEIVNAGSIFIGIHKGTVQWGLWQEFLPYANLPVIRDLLFFVQDGRYINLSRISPTSIAARAMASNRHEIYIGNGTAICISLGLVRNSAIHEPMGNQYPYHGIRMVLHSYEYHRWAAVLGELPRMCNLETQIWDYAVLFSTKTMPTEEESDVKTLKPGMDKFFKTYESPKKKASSSASGKLPNHVGALEFAESIQVYDARKLSDGFVWNAEVFDNLHGHFAIYPGAEIPENSLVATGYVTQYYTLPSRERTSSFYQKSTGDEKLRFACMIRWVLLFGVAGED